MPKSSFLPAQIKQQLKFGAMLYYVRTSGSVIVFYDRLWISHLNHFSRGPEVARPRPFDFADFARPFDFAGVRLLSWGDSSELKRG